MTAGDVVNDYSSDDSIDAHVSDSSTSESENSRNATFPQQGGLRPAGSVPNFVPFAHWNPERSYEGATTSRYNVEWKLFVKNRERAGQSELDIVISPKEFWKYILRPRLDEESAEHGWKAGAVLFVLSANDRKTKSIRKRYTTQAKIEWSFVAKTIQSWIKSLGSDKTVTVDIKFYYEQPADQQPTGKAGRGATVKQRAILGAIVSEEVAYMGRPAAIRIAYAAMRCTGPPCPIKGSTHCWVHEGKHRRLWPHHMRMLAEHVQSGGALNSHDDVPEGFRKQILDEEKEWEERERKEREKKRKRQRRDSGGSLTIHPCQQCTHGASSAPLTPKMVFPTSPLFNFGMPREDIIAAYTVWQKDQSKSDEQRLYYDLVQEVTIAEGYTLDMIASNQERMCKVYERHDIPEGIAWNYVCNIPWFGKQRETALNLA